MQQLQSPALPLDRINSMRAELARFDTTRIDNATLQAFLAHVSAPSSVLHGASTLPTHAAAHSAPAATQHAAAAQTISMKVEEAPKPVARQPRDAFLPLFPEKPKLPAADAQAQGAPEPHRPPPTRAPAVPVPTRTRSSNPARRPRDMSGFAAQFLGRGPGSGARRSTKRPGSGTAPQQAQHGLDDTQPSMDEKEVAQLLLELNPVRNGPCSGGTAPAHAQEAAPSSPRRKQPRLDESAAATPAQAPAAAPAPTQPLPLFPSRPSSLPSRPSSVAVNATVNAPQALARAVEPRPPPVAWRGAPWAVDAVAAATAGALPPQHAAAKPLLQALLAQHALAPQQAAARPQQAAKPQVDEAKREELARLFRPAAEAVARGGSATAAAVSAVSTAAEMVAARPLVPAAPRVALTAADLAATAARRLHDAQMIALLQEGTLSQKKEAAFMALAHAKLPPHKRQLIWEELMDRERRLRAAKEVAAFHQAAAAAAATDARPRTAADAATPPRTAAAPACAPPAKPAATPTVQPLTLAVAAAAALRGSVASEPAAMPAPRSSSAGPPASAPAASAAAAVLPRYRPAHSITTAPSLEELYQDVNATPAAPPADVMMPGKKGALVTVLSSKDEETLALQAAAREVADTPPPPPPLINAESATAATPGTQRTASKLLDAFDLPTLGAAQGSNTGTVLEAAAAAAAATRAETGDGSGAVAASAGHHSGSGGSGEQNVAVGPLAPVDGTASARAALSAALDSASGLSDTRRAATPAKELKRARSI
eukprot:jgi/Ulvmu1/11138/UM071_0022.1